MTMSCHTSQMRVTSLPLLCRQTERMLAQFATALQEVKWPRSADFLLLSPQFPLSLMRQKYVKYERAHKTKISLGMTGGAILVGRRIARSAFKSNGIFFFQQSDIYRPLICILFDILQRETGSPQFLLSEEVLESTSCSMRSHPPCCYKTD